MIYRLGVNNLQRRCTKGYHWCRNVHGAIIMTLVPTSLPELQAIRYLIRVLIMLIFQLRARRIWHNAPSSVEAALLDCDFTSLLYEQGQNLVRSDVPPGETSLAGIVPLWPASPSARVQRRVQLEAQRHRIAGEASLITSKRQARSETKVQAHFQHIAEGKDEICDTNHI